MLVPRQATVILVVTTTQTVAPSSSSVDSTSTQYVFQTVVASALPSINSASASPTSSSFSEFAASSTATSASSAPSLTSKTTTLSLASALSSPTLPVNISAYTESGTTSSNSKLGLAIGIPMAVLSLCIIAAIAWSYFHKKAANLSEGFVSYGHSKEEPPTVATIAQNWSHSPQPQVSQRKAGLLNRLSRKINFSEWPGSPREFKSPLFLRRFHLLNEKVQSSNDKPFPSLPNISTNRAESLDVIDERNTELNLVGKKFLAVQSYSKRLGDELSLCAGEKVTVKKIHADGWVTVEVGSSLGLVPMMCLKKI